MIQEKFDRKVAEMKASGASQDEIDKFTVEFKKKVAAMNNGQSQGSMDEKEFMEKVKQKAMQMKAAGASEDEINKMVTEAKLKWAQMNAKVQKDGQDTKPRKIQK